MDLYLRTSGLLVFVLVQCDAEVRVNLTSAVGSSITFPDPVKQRGFLDFRTRTIALIYNGVFEIEEDIYTNRLHWNSSTGHFTLSDLQKNDSGVYAIDSKKGNVFYKLYELKVFDPVSRPVVSCVNVSADICTLQCSVTLTEQTTLSWFRGEQPVDSSSSAVQLLTVQLRNNTPEYKCVAQNPADEKIVTVDITTLCTNLTSDANTKNSQPVAIIIPIVFAALIMLCFVFFVIKKKKCFKKESASRQTQADVTSAPSVKTLKAIEGGNVTFWSGLSKQTHAILSYGNVTLLNYDNGKILKKQSKICVENGTIIMTNIHQNDSNHIYKLQIVGLEVETHNFKLNVTKCQLQVSDYTSVPPTQHPSTQEKTDHTTVALIIVGLVVVVVVVVVGWIIYCKREKLRKRDLWKVIFRKQSTNLTNGNYHGSTSHRVETSK